MKKQTKQTEQKPRREVRIYLGFEAWWATGEKLFGPDMNKWAIQCPECDAVCHLGEFSDGEMDTENLKDLLDELSEECPWCDHDLRAEGMEYPYHKNHSARLITRRNDEQDTDSDYPIFDFYRPAETSERTRATGKTD
jgi:hypothetical protein